MAWSRKLDPIREKAEAVWCFEQRIRGLTLHKIAEEFEIKFGRSVSHQTIASRIKNHINEQLPASAAELREIEMARLEDLRMKLQKKVDEGDDKAINTALRVSESLRKLQGLDAPTKQDIVVAGVTEADLFIGNLIAARKKESLEILTLEAVEDDTEENPQMLGM